MSAERRGPRDPTTTGRGTWYPGRDGTMQGERLPEALSEGYFAVDERELPDLLCIAARLASNLTYRDPNNEPAGSWSDLYSSDAACVMAEIATLDSHRLEATFLRHGRGGDMRGQALYIRNLATRLDRWLGVLVRDEQPMARSLAWTISEMVSGELVPALHGAGSYLEQEARAGGELRLSHLWEVDDADGRPSFPRSLLPESRGDRRTYLASCYYSFQNAFADLKRPARDALAESLRSQDHDPAVGLVLTFLTLFGHAQDRLNDFTHRRLDFYYRRLLGMEPRGSMPDRAHLVLAPAPGVPSVYLPRGTEFAGGRDEARRELVFSSDDDLVVTDTRVVSLRTVHYERNPLISPERELGFATRVRGLAVGEAGIQAAEKDETPVFVTRVDGAAHYAGNRVPLGFAVASPILELAEGMRTVTFEIELGEAASWPASTTEELVTHLQTVREGQAEALFSSLGVIMTRALLGGFQPPDPSVGANPWGLSEASRAEIRAQARRVLSRDPVGDGPSIEVVDHLLAKDPLMLFHELFRTAFEVRFTGSQGWEDVVDLYVGPLARPGSPALGLRVEMSLGPDVGPVVGHSAPLHGDAYETAAPVMEFQMNAQAIFCPFSLLQPMELRAVDVEVQVDGVTDLAVHNHLGRLDPTKPFLPFGPLPSLESYLVVASYEAAEKPLVAASLDIEWGELPRGPGGFRQHYSGYGIDITDASFKAEVSVLRDGRWYPDKEDQRPRERLFRTEGRNDVLARDIHVRLGVVEAFKPISSAVDKEQFQTITGVRDGLFKLSLAGSDAPFGHREYPTRLSEVLSANARRKHPLPVPDPPYTPLVNRLTLGYVARTRLRPGIGATGQASGSVERIFHRHPFGTRALDVVVGERPGTLLPAPPGGETGGPSNEREGYLFIGLSGSAVSGSLALLFHLRNDATHESAVVDPQLAWYYLAEDCWRRLHPSRVLSDSTERFQRSGIVTLDIPEDIVDSNPIMPTGTCWLAVGANRNLKSIITRLLSVSAGAMMVTWSDRGNRRSDLQRGLPPGTIGGPVAPITGLGSVRQVGESFDGRAPEAPDDLMRRTSERLRHKARAASPWDFERLVLEHFPGVLKVKVFPNTDTRFEQPVPGRVLVIVVPKLHRQIDDGTLTPRIGGSTILRIRDFLNRVSSTFARVHVRNAIYEQVQVRCAVKLSVGANSGRSVREMNRAIVDYLSPWCDGGYGPRFGWTVRRKEIEARVRTLSFVEFVTDFSMLHITRDAMGRHRLEDTARSGTPGDPWDDGSVRRTTAYDQVSARYPWSLAIPTPRHFIQLIPEAEEIAAEVTGVGELEIGSNFILNARDANE